MREQLVTSYDEVHETCSTVASSRADELDVREFRRSASRSSPAAWTCGCAALDLPGVRLLSELGELAAGDPAHLVLPAPARSLRRVLPGRLSDDVRRFDRDGDPSPLLPVSGACRTSRPLSVQVSG